MSEPLMGWDLEQAKLHAAIKRAGLASNALISLCAGLIWRQAGFRQALAFVDGVARDRGGRP